MPSLQAGVSAALRAKKRGFYEIILPKEEANHFLYVELVDLGTKKMSKADLAELIAWLCGYYQTLGKPPPRRQPGGGPPRPHARTEKVTQGACAMWNRYYHEWRMVRVFRYRLYPTRGQEAALHRTLGLLRELYNAALQERRDAYRTKGATRSGYDQMASLPEVKALRPEFGAVYSQLLQDCLARLDRAYRAFFRRVKAGEAPGYPRFKGRGRYRTFTFKQPGNGSAKLAAGGKRVKLAGIGLVKLKLHRPLEGRIKQASVTLAGDGHFYVAFACEDVPPEPLAPTGASVGIDVGITTFAALSDGTMVDNPRPFERAQAKLRRAQRSLARRTRGSARRREQAARVAGLHDRVRRTRLDFHHQVARQLVERFDAIAVEDLRVRGLARSKLAKQVHDAAWAQFLTILASKAECAGRELVRVDPRGTSQVCSDCGADVRKGLHVRVHRCPHCGCEADRDVNAARNIERLGRSRRGGLSVGRPVEPRSPLLAR
jgi:putative transposase